MIRPLKMPATTQKIATNKVIEPLLTLVASYVAGHQIAIAICHHQLGAAPPTCFFCLKAGKKISKVF